MPGPRSKRRSRRDTVRKLLDTLVNRCPVDGSDARGLLIFVMAEPEVVNLRTGIARARSRRRVPMLGVVATIKVKPGMEQQFEAVAKELVAKVHANEPGCRLYALHRAEAPQTYVFMERYTDQAAVEAHRATDYVKALGRKMGEFMDGRAEVLRLTEI